MIGDRVGNSPKQAQVLGTVAGTVRRKDWIGGSDKNDYYRFTVGSQTQLSLSLTRLQRAASIELQTQSGEILQRSSRKFSSSKFIQASLNPGTYYAIVKGGRQATRYRVALTTQVSAAADLQPLQNYTYTYFFGNGDSYSGSGYASVGAYAAGQTLADTAPNETGNLGYYRINGATDVMVSASLNSTVSITQYFDAETNTTFTPAYGSGVAGLGSETGSLGGVQSEGYFGQRYFEADSSASVYRYGFTYYYNGQDKSNSDSYTGYVYANPGRYSVGSYFDYTTAANATGQNGQYYITDVSIAGTYSDLGKVYVKSYYDVDLSGSTVAPYYGTTSGYSSGDSYLGSEYDSISDGSVTSSFGLDYYEADLPAKISTISLTSPNGGGSLQQGVAYTIAWNDNLSENIRIDLFKGNSLYTTIAASTPSDGVYSWTVPTQIAAGSDYQLRIQSLSNPGIYDYSDRTFSVVAAPASGFNIQFDYRFDTVGWFTPERRAALEAAASIWESIILDEFADTPVGTDTPYVLNPQTGAYVGTNDIFTTDTVIDDVLIFVGARELGGSTLGLGGPSGNYANESRYVGADFEPWIGSVSFDTTSSWFFDSTPSTTDDIPWSQSDFISTALHEIGHVLGFNRSVDAFSNLVVNDTFAGANAKAQNGGNSIPLQTGGSHIRDGYEFGGSGETLMDPTSMSGSRQSPTLLDIAILDDIGYTVNYGAATQNTTTLLQTAEPRIIGRCGCASCLTASTGLNEIGTISLEQSIMNEV